MSRTDQKVLSRTVTPGGGGLSALNEAYAAEQYERYCSDPQSVSDSWRRFFEGGAPSLAAAPTAQAAPQPSFEKALAFVELVRSLRERGHEAASLDPLELKKPDTSAVSPEGFGLSGQDLESVSSGVIESVRGSIRSARTGSDLVHALRETYCGATGYEFAHLRNPGERQWLQDAVESGQFRPEDDPDLRRKILDRLTDVEVFEQFLHQSFPGQKWFSISGLDTLILVLDEISQRVAFSSVRHVALGMAHRGRLNVLAHIFGESYVKLLAGFSLGHFDSESTVENAGPGRMSDVKYHEGARREIDSEETGEHSFVLLPNPSHLELVNPVALGMVRAYRDLDRADADSALAILVHGDSAFPGQGVVAESLNLAQLPAYGVGGTIHIIANNQLGFTAESHESFSGRYSSDPARGLDIPIVHVNADDVEACIAAGRLAFAYRKTFGKDFLIDLVGYRRYGHNEGDEPSFTQPQMYQAIEAHPSTRALWAERLSSEGLISRNQAEVVVGEVRTHLRSALDEAWKSDDKHRRALWFGESGSALSNATGLKPATRDALIRWNKALHAHPESFHLNPKLQRAFQRRASALDKGGRIDWPHAESLAFASILQHGISVRLVGQDTERGTFSQRHAVLHDVETGERHIPLAALGKDGASFVIANSPLSEQAALGFEYGYSIAAPRHLVLWEAQFGDFVNNAQSVIDEFVASAWAKWGLPSGLVLLLPHGYEGQGPNHSDAHLERFLQLAAEDNLGVVAPSTAAQYFHVLRKQADSLSDHRRPLVVMTGKSLLRHPFAAVEAADLVGGEFQAVVDDPRMAEEPGGVRRVILCAGKVAADLFGSDEYANSPDVAVVRVESLYPFPAERLAATLKQYPNAAEVAWVQEESRNRGAWSFVEPRIRALLGEETRLLYIGRPEWPSPAEGSPTQHRANQAEIVRRAFAKLEDDKQSSAGPAEHQKREVSHVR